MAGWPRMSQAQDTLAVLTPGTYHATKITLCPSTRSYSKLTSSSLRKPVVIEIDSFIILKCFGHQGRLVLAHYIHINTGRSERMQLKVPTDAADG